MDRTPRMCTSQNYDGIYHPDLSNHKKTKDKNLNELDSSGDSMNI